jgi:hypothetical protein
VQVTGAGAATLTISRTAGASGGAHFVKASGFSTNTITVPGNATTTITIYGDDVSDVARNMQLQATLGGAAAGSWSFTVFSVTPTLLIDPNTKIVDAVPVSVKDAPPASQSLQQRMLRATKDEPNLGHHTDTTGQAYGGMAIRGQILPRNMNPADFNPAPDSRSQAFNWDRVMSIRGYLNGSLYKGEGDSEKRWLPTCAPMIQTSRMRT